jgi:transposase
MMVPCEPCWQLTRHICASQIQDVRDLTPTRTQLAREVAQHIQRIQKTLESGNIKLISVNSNVTGTRGDAS